MVPSRNGDQPLYIPKSELEEGGYCSVALQLHLLVTGNGALPRCPQGSGGVPLHLLLPAEPGSRRTPTAEKSRPPITKYALGENTQMCQNWGSGCLREIKSVGFLQGV